MGMLFGGLGGGMWPGHINYGRVEDRPLLTRAKVLRILGYFRPYWRNAALVLLCIATSSLLGLVPPLLVREAIDVAIPRGDGPLLNLLVLGMVVVPLLAGLVGVAQNYLNVQVGQRVMFDLRNQLYQHLQGMSLRFFTATRTGEMMSRLNNDVAGIQGTVTGTMVNVVTNAVTVTSTLVVIFSMDWRLSLLAVGILPLFILPTRRVGRLRHNLSRETHQQQAELSAHMQETLNISGYLLMKVFGRDQYETERFRQRSQTLMDLQVRQSMVGRWFFMTLGLFGAVGPALIYLVGGHLAIQQQLTVGTIVAFVAYLARLYGPVSALANVHVDFMAALALFDRIFHYLDMAAEIVDRPGALHLDRAEGHLRFEGVSFSYGKGAPALEEISFEAQPGQLVALVGPSGAGKTTITYLIPRFYDPTAGAIFLDGHDLRDLTLASLRSHIGMVTQEVYLFNATIRENLRYARPDATDADLIAACQAAHIHDFIASLPDGYDTLVGERGYRLSGGEKQRIAIARVILKDPRILILDEATSSLDSESEAHIQAALQPLLRGRTTIAIAHRLSTVLAADLILVLDRGRIVERGTHADLLARGGLYARLYEQQFQRETWRARLAEPWGNGREPGPEDEAAATPAWTDDGEEADPTAQPPGPWRGGPWHGGMA